jgi:hypothetical protein
MGQFNSLKMSIIGGIHAATYFRSELQRATACHSFCAKAQSLYSRI